MKIKGKTADGKYRLFEVERTLSLLDGVSIELGKKPEKICWKLDLLLLDLFGENIWEQF